MVLPLLSFILVSTSEYFSVGGVHIAFMLSVMCCYFFLNIYLFFLFVHECLYVCICTMHVPGTYRGQKKRHQIGDIDDCWLPYGESQVLCKGTTAEDLPSPECIIIVLGPY